MAEELTLSADALAKITGMFDPVNASITKMQEDHKGYTGQAEEIKANVDAFVSKFESKVKDLQTEVKTLMARNERPDASIKTADTGGFVRLSHFMNEVLQKEVKKGQGSDIFTQYVAKCQESENKGREAIRLEKAPAGFAETYEDDGGVLVPVDFSQALMARRNEISSILPLLTNYGPISGTKVVIPAFDDASRETGSRYGGVSTAWLDEAEELTATKGKFRRVTMEVNKIGAMFYVTSEMLRDAFIAVENIFMNIVMKEMAWRTEDAVFHGNGIAKPRGFVSHPATIPVPKGANQSSKEPITADNVIEMWSRMPAEYIDAARWVCSHELYPYFMKLAIKTGTGGQLVFMPPGGLTEAPYGTLLGKPIILSEHCKKRGDLGDIFFMNFGEIGYIDKGSPETANSMHVKFTTDEMAFRVTQRLDAHPMWDTALTPAYYTTTSGVKRKLSPYITLASRN